MSNDNTQDTPQPIAQMWDDPRDVEYPIGSEAWVRRRAFEIAESYTRTMDDSFEQANEIEEVVNAALAAITAERDALKAELAEAIGEFVSLQKLYGAQPYPEDLARIAELTGRKEGGK